MNKQIQVKRNKPSGSRYRVLYAKTGRKRRLHAATTATADKHAGLGSDVPSIGIGRALIVILLLHVLAIAAIYIHTTSYGDQSNETANQGQQSSSSPAAVTTVASKAAIDKAPAAKPRDAKVTLDPAIAKHIKDRYHVMTGDNYASIARNRNVDERALRALNNNKPLRAGLLLDMPAELSSHPVNPAPVAKVNEQPAGKTTPKSVADEAPKASVSEPAKAVVVKPNLPKAAVAASDDDTQDSGERYTIKSGDTLWGISNRFKVSRDAILKINGIEDPNKLYAGRTIKIPAN